MADYSSHKFHISFSPLMWVIREANGSQTTRVFKAVAYAVISISLNLH